jgi:predicted RND superfamily exporter protein
MAEVVAPDTIEDMQAMMQAIDKKLAANRVLDLADLSDLIKAMDLPKLATALRKIKPNLPRTEDQQTFENFAITTENYQQLADQALTFAMQKAELSDADLANLKTSRTPQQVTPAATVAATVEGASA